MPDLIELHRVCGMFDAPYVARYKRDESGGLVLVEVVGVDWQAPQPLPMNKRTAGRKHAPGAGRSGS
jgi:hypothetical protein